MKRLPAPEILIRQWLQNPHAITVAAFTIAAVFMGIAGWLIHRNLRHNEPGLRAPCALPFALIVAVDGLFGAGRLPAPWAFVAGSVVCALAALLFHYANHRRLVRDPAGQIVADRWQIVVAFAGFRWTRDKANRHFFFTGDTGAGKTSGMNGLLAALISRNPTLGGVVIANKGDEWFYLEWLAKKYGRSDDIIRLRPRLVGETDEPLHRLNVTGDARFPAWRSSDIRPSESLKQSGATSSTGKKWKCFLNGLVLVHVALATLLVSGAGLLVRSVIVVLHTDPGLNPANLPPEYLVSTRGVPCGKTAANGATTNSKTSWLM